MTGPARRHRPRVDDGNSIRRLASPRGLLSGPAQAGAGPALPVVGPRRQLLQQGLLWWPARLLPATLPATLVACSPAEDGAWARVRQRGALVVGYAVEPPYADVSPAGVVQGESPTVARRVAERLGLARVDWVQTTFARLLDELDERRFDLIAAGLFITEARRRRVHFSRPTLHVREGWLARPGHGLAGLSYAAARQRSGLRVVVLGGSQEQQQLGPGGAGGATVIVAPDAVTARAAVRNGLADALALSLPSVRHMAAADPLHLTALAAAPSSTPPGSGIQQVALAMRRGEASLHQAVDGALARYIGTPAHLLDLQALGFVPDDLPAPDPQA